jgi:hypothetical protein
MKCRCGSPATHRRHAPWEAKGTELLCDLIAAVRQLDEGAA